MVWRMHRRRANDYRELTSPFSDLSDLGIGFDISDNNDRLGHAID